MPQSLQKMSDFRTRLIKTLSYRDEYPNRINQDNETRCFTLYQGYVRATLQLADGALPLADRNIYIKTTGITQTSDNRFLSDFPVDSERYTYRLLTDSSGATQSVSVEAPDPAISLNEYNPDIPYSAVDVYANVAGYFPVRVLHVPVFAGKTSTLPLLLTPLSKGYAGTTRRYHRLRNTAE